MYYAALLEPNDDLQMYTNQIYNKKREKPNLFLSSYFLTFEEFEFF